MRFEEVVVFMCGLMKDPTALIHHICKKFNEMNIDYLGDYQRVPDEEKETELKCFGKTALNLEFFHLIYAESRIHLPWLPLQNPHFNWFDHERDDQHGLARDRSCVCIPSEYYNFQNLKEPISSHNIQEHEQFGQCSIVVDNPHPDVVESLLLTCSIICMHQSVVNLCLFNIIPKNTTIDNIFKLSSNAEFLVIEDCIFPSNMMTSLFQQMSVCPDLKGIRLDNSTFEEPGKSLIHLSEAIRKWGSNNGLEYLVICNCSLLQDQCSSILQSISTCKYLTYICLSNNVVGSGGKHLAESIRNWGFNPPLRLLYLANCGLHEDDCTELLQSLLGCLNIESLNLSGNNIGQATKYLVEVIQKLSSYGKLEKLYLYDCSFPEDWCVAILQSLLLSKQLTCLDLSNNKIQNAGKDLAESIKQWGVNPPLQGLDLRNCRLHEDDCAEILQSLLGCVNLVEITLSENTIGKAVKHLVEVIQKLSSYGKLQELYLYDCSFAEDQCATVVKSLSLCKQLTCLDLSNNRIQNAGKDLADSIKQWDINPSLQELDLCNCGLHQDDCVELLQSLLGCVNLKKIGLSGNTIKKAMKHLVEVIQKLSSYGKLEKLYLSDCSFPEDQCAAILQSLSLCKQLTCLSLSNNTIQNAGKDLADSVKQWGFNPPLKELHLRNCGLHEDDCAEILQSLLGCVNLVEITLSGNTIGKAARHLVEAINKLSSYGKLQDLYLSDCSFAEDQCATVVKSLSLCKQLTCLDLSNNRIQNAGKDLADSIKQWDINPSLQELDLCNSGLHQDDCVELLQSLLGCVNLKKIGLSGNTIKKAMKHLVEVIQKLSSYGKLEKLYLSDCSFPEDQCAAILQSLSLCKQLTCLSLSNNTIQNAGKDLADSIKQWGFNPPLKELHLRNCGLHGDDCAEILSLCWDVSTLWK